MRVEQSDLAGVAVFIPEPAFDTRGFFTRTFDAVLFDDFVGTAGASATLIEDSQSRSAQGVVRGLHGRAGLGESKLVRCANGAIYDVIVDIRSGSPTFGEHRAFILDDKDFRHLFIPRGFLHGFQALTPTADVCYRIDRPHDPREDIAVDFADAELGIVWPRPVTVVSARDAGAGSWAELLRHVT